jgi:hypothetical protein
MILPVGTRTGGSSGDSSQLHFDLVFGTA